MQTPSTQSNHAPQAFIKKYQADVTGILQGFDRLRLQGTLRSLYHPASMEAYLQLAHVLWKDFKRFTTGITARIRAASEGIARAAGRPFRYLASVNLRKEEEAKKLLNIEHELHRRIISQRPAISALARAIRRSRAGLKNPHKPVGSFLFLGPTGVGKTELTKALAEANRAKFSITSKRDAGTLVEISFPSTRVLAE